MLHMAYATQTHDGAKRIAVQAELTFFRPNVERTYGSSSQQTHG